MLVPPRMFCERCFRGTDAWTQVENTGVVQTFSICNVRWDMQPLDEPELPAVISIDGSDGGFLHMLGEVKPDEVAHRDGGGGRVEAGRRAHRVDPGHRVLPAAERRLMLEKIARPEEIRRWEGDLPVRHRYTPGVAGDAFFTALKERGVLLGSRCEHCAYTYVPARLFCERCFAELSADTEVGPGGELVSFTIVFHGIEGEAARPARDARRGVGSTARTRC